MHAKYVLRSHNQQFTKIFDMNKNLKIFFKNKTVMLTGGTGSFGKAFLSYIIKYKFYPKKLIIYSRDELKQFEMRKLYSVDKYPFLRFFIGDIRDKERLELAVRDVDIVVHAAALKQVPAAEYNPIEFIKTNIIGAQNLIECCLLTSVKSVIALSTDKASSPVNLYGATKLCSDKLFIAANNIRGKQDIKFSIVRYGNVMGSRGSVIENFFQKQKLGVFDITDKEMTRFNITLDEAIDFVMWSLINSKGGEIFVPKIPSFYIVDLAKAVRQDCKFNFIGIRQGEKLHEEMISVNDSINTVDLGKFYAILNDSSFNFYKNCKFVKKNFNYRSDTNQFFLNIMELKKIISSLKTTNKSNNFSEIH
jgi:UDP-N-acetylglucosamine 4,6-dehydratase